MKVAILTANLGNFDTPVDPVTQIHSKQWEMDVDFHRFTDENFPPIIGLTPRLQYRIPKMFGWEMMPGYDFYIWLDGSMSLQRADSVEWLIEQLGDRDMAFFKHPWRKTIKEEVDFIEQKLQEGNRYLTPRYKNGLHKEQLATIQLDPHFKDDVLYASNVFIYRKNEATCAALTSWWLHSSRYFTCDQIPLPYVLFKHDISVNFLPGDPFKSPYVSLVSAHK